VIPRVIFTGIEYEASMTKWDSDYIFNDERCKAIGPADVIEMYSKFYREFQERDC